MTKIPNNLRKAAVFIRSLDADTAANLLAQLSPEEAREIRAAIRSLGALDPEEQADVAAEFRRTSLPGNRIASPGVELELSSAGASKSEAPLGESPLSRRRFEFLEEAPVEALAKFLSREHVQTIAVVLSYLPPGRAAAVLAAFSPKLQADAMERLSVLGDTDPVSLTVLEHELSAWLAQRSTGHPGASRRGDTVLSILAATDAATRNGIMANLTTHSSPLAKQLAPLLRSSAHRETNPQTQPGRWNIQAEGLGMKDWALESRSMRATAARSSQPPASRPQPPVSSPQPPAPRLSFDDLALLSASDLAIALRDADANVLVLALAGSSNELVDRICQHMPRRTAKTFRRQLRQLGPTRLSDVEEAQRLVAAAAGRQLGCRRPRAMTVNS